jgi:Spy/CpxP family protein refolding chaperone
MVAAVTSVGSGSAGGKNVNAQIAALQKQFGEMHKKMEGLQQQMMKTGDLEAKKSLQLQVQSISTQMQMIQQQISMLRSQDSAAHAVKNAPAPDSAKAAAQAGGKPRDVMLGSLVDTQA